MVIIYIFYWFRKWAEPNSSTAPPVKNVKKFMKNQWFDLNVMKYGVDTLQTCDMKSY